MTLTNITVLGAGTMGHGIAQVAAQAGYTVTICDLQQDVLDRAITTVRANLDKGVEKGKLDRAAADATLGKLATSTELPRTAATADLIIEAIPERMDWKIGVVKECFAAGKPTMVFATNTSSLSVTEIAAAASDPTRVIGMHFFNPPYILKLLEIVTATQTSESTLQIARDVGVKMEREMIVVRDSPGFATSRLGLAIGLEAMRMVDEGVASPADIDRAMELGYKHPMGPLKLTDLVGLDVRLAIAEYLHRELGEQFRPPKCLRQLVRAGKLGKKTGEGFYKW
jgi:3-hydroxybutyryl-CoA dehydrogenase